MTATTTSYRSDYYDGQGDELGVVATLGAQIFVFFVIIYSFNVTGLEIFPALTPVALFAGTIGVFFLAPRKVMMRLPVSLLLLAMIGWLLASSVWSDSPNSTALAIQNAVPILVGMMICIGMISMRQLVPALVWSVRFSVLLTLAVIAVYPETRIHIDPAGLAPPFAGWHGWFPHKNVMTPFLVFGALTILTFDRTRVFRLVTLAGIGALLAGSASVTGMSSALLAISVWVWLQLFRNLDIRNSSIFVISSISVGLFGLLGIAASLATLTSASGRDLTFTGRTFIWQATLNALAERPFLGYGLSGILTTDPTTSRTAEVWREIGFRVPHAHNGALDLAVQLGVIGLGIFGLLYITTMGDSIRMVRDRPKVAAWIVSTLVVQLYMSFSENVFLGNGWLPVLFMFRILLQRQDGMELSTGTALADRVRRTAPLEPAAP